MKAFIDEHRDAYGVEPICRVLPIAPSTYHDHAARTAYPSTLSARAKRDAILKVEVRRVFVENFGVYGVRKVWRQMRREGFDVARCTISRLMREMGLKGAVRGKLVRTTIRDASVPCPLDRVNRVFKAQRDCQEFRVGRRIEDQAAIDFVKRSPKRMANWALAMAHSRGAILHSFSERFKTRNRSFMAASSLGKWPRALTARHSLEFSASIWFVSTLR